MQGIKLIYTQNEETNPQKELYGERTYATFGEFQAVLLILSIGLSNML